MERNKILFVGDGNALESQVKRILEELGVKVMEGAKGRDDLILEFEGRPAVVEIKGLTKSAGEKNAAQLEKWVAGYIDTHEVVPKGILLINTFKELPLVDRKLDSFPHQMLNYSERREHCLITGLQLLGLYLDAKANPEKRETLVRSLFETVGIYKGYEDWRSFLGEGEPTAGK